MKAKSIKIIIEQLFSLHLNVIVVLLQATSKDSKENNNYKIGYKLRKNIAIYKNMCSKESHEKRSEYKNTMVKKEVRNAVGCYVRS